MTLTLTEILQWLEKIETIHLEELNGGKTGGTKSRSI
jgi:hypothetical protein